LSKDNIDTILPKTQRGGMDFDDVPLSWLPLVGLLAIPSALAFVVLEPVAAVTVVNVLLITVAVRVMFGSADLEYLPPRDDDPR
jgi:hypothetical protein